MGPKGRLLGISHRSGELELWRIEILLNLGIKRPRAEKIFKNLCNSDFIIFY